MNFERTYKDVKVTVLAGDITEQRVDAIVNPANSLLIMGGGVAGAIKHVGGAEIQAEATKQAPIPIGKAIATPAGRLRAKHVIHTPTMQRPAMTVGKKNVQLATEAALECAETLKIKSVAFPGLGTGVGGVSSEEAAGTMLQALKKHIDAGTALHEVVFVGFSQKLADAFKEAVVKILI